MALELVDLGLGSLPSGGDKWRLVVRNDGIRGDGASLGARWYNGAGSGGLFGGYSDNGMSTLGKGFPASQPVSSGEYFCLDVKFPSNPPQEPLSSLVRFWEANLGGQVVRVKEIRAGESSQAGRDDRAAQLQAALEDAPLGPVEELKRKADRALTTLQILGLAVIVAGGVYLVARSRSR